MKPQWARDVRDQCIRGGVSFFMKQWGDYKNNPFISEDDLTLKKAKIFDPPTNGKGGALLDNRLWRQFPDE